MDVFIMIRRKKSTIFLNANETTSVLQIQKMVEGITNVPPLEQRLYKVNEKMSPKKLLKDYNINSSTATPQEPAEVGLVFKDTETGIFEDLEISPVSIPPELPNVMNPDLNSNE